MRKVLFIFLDGVGLGSTDPTVNPFAAASTPALDALLEGRRLVASAAPFEGASASLVPLDARMHTSGTPQSASGQAAILTGRNVPQEIGGHYGPKPNPQIAAILQQGSIFAAVAARGGRAALINAYPPRYFQAVNSGLRLYSAIPMAVNAAGIDLMTAQDLQQGRAMSVDFTGEGWAAQPDFPPIPIYSSTQAGQILARLSMDYELAWFDFWPSDIAGHKGSMRDAVSLIERFDEVFSGLIEMWKNRDDLIVVSSDHGNLEDLSVKGHTLNPVPALVIGPAEARKAFTRGLKDLTDFYHAILEAIFPAGQDHEHRP
jgi:2,3-bisphosphoglycerate-independent phosphoglycerate mutase